MSTRYQDQRWFGKEGVGMQDPRNLNFLVQDMSRTDSDLVSAQVLAADMQATAVLASARVNLEDDPRLGSVRRTITAVGKWWYRHPWDGNQQPTPRCTGFSGIKKWLGGKKLARDIYNVLKRAMDLTRLRDGQTIPTYERIEAGLTLDAALDWLADLLYRAAWARDQKEGRNFGPLGVAGCTMLALAKAGVELGLWKSYYWGYTLADYMTAIQLDSVLIGMDWKEGCDDPDGKWGVMRYRGRTRGGHSICSDGGDLDDGMGRFDQTWGRASFGRRSDGYAFMPFEDIGMACADGAEILVTVE